MSPRSLARRGFTLIEILLVIAVIGILSTLMFSLFKAAKNGNNKAKARGEIQGLSMACEVYKKTYGDYPCGSSKASSTNGIQFRKDFFDQLVGRKRIYTANLSSGGNAIRLLNYTDTTLPGGTNRKMKPFLSDGVVTSNDDKSLGLDDWTKATNSAIPGRMPTSIAIAFYLETLLPFRTFPLGPMTLPMERGNILASFSSHAVPTSSSLRLMVMLRLTSNTGMAPICLKRAPSRRLTLATTLIARPPSNGPII